MNFQDMIATLIQFWAKRGCVVHQGYDLEVGAGTFNPATFLRCLGPEPYSAVYVEPSRRPKDGRYGENPNRVQFYHQMQVIMKPSPKDIKEMYLQSLEAIGFDLSKHDIRFVHDDWENPTIGAWGLGWEVWADGMEVTQFTYFQAVGGIPVSPVSGEITYGLERIAMYIQGVDSMFDLKWNESITYGDIFKRNEWEWSHYNFEKANTAMWLSHFDDFEAEAKHLIRGNLPIPAYDFVMKASHAFNILDARGVISVTERTGYIGRIRHLAKELAEAYIKSRKEQSFPLMRLSKSEEKQPVAPHTFSSFSASESQDFLIEVGSEELPATFISNGIAHFKHLMSEFLKKHSLIYSSIEMYATPRRLALVVKDLKGGTQGSIEEKKGPSLNLAFDENGHLSKIGAGFLKSLNCEPLSKKELENGVNPSLTIQSVKGEKYLFAKRTIPALSTRELLSKNLPELILKIEFPKKMRWGSGDIEYARPIRWLTALYGSEVIPFRLGECQSSHISFGHSQLDPGSFSLPHASSYAEVLKAHFVAASIEERKHSILAQLKEVEESYQAYVEAKEKVLSQVVHLTEWPQVCVGSFDSLYLKAPKEVIICEMVEHQKYFPLASNQTKELIPHFIIVCNHTPQETIKKGNEKALTPRLADGLFLFEQDLKTPLDEFTQKLKHIIFQKDLGSVFGKVERLITNVEILHSFLKIADLDKVKRAAYLCKADLATAIVGEFPELQGTMGKLLAYSCKEDAEVANAIDEHWMPKGEKGQLPHTPSGILLSLAEKMDNFLSYFALHLEPTSSSDPYALRRQALGFARILIQAHLSLPLEASLKACLDNFVKHPEISSSLKEHLPTDLIPKIKTFICNRLKSVFLEEGFEKDEIEAISDDIDDIYESYSLIAALHQFRKEHSKEFSNTLTASTRVRKILSGVDCSSYTVDERLFNSLHEKKLYDELLEIEKEQKELIQQRRYLQAFLLLSTLYQPLENLFNDVKIMDENLSIRANRICLLHRVDVLFKGVIDFSKIQVHES